jgi:hypothetical protein
MTEKYYFTVLEARSPKSRYWFLPRAERNLFHASFPAPGGLRPPAYRCPSALYLHIAYPL